MFAELNDFVTTRWRHRGSAPSELRKFDGGEGTLAMMARDRNSETVKLVKPTPLHGPSLSIGKDDGLADKLRPGNIERAKDR
jgi:hypothetical protein